MPLKTILWTLATLALLLLTAVLLLPALPPRDRASKVGASPTGQMPICHRTSLAKSTWKSTNLILSEVDWALAHGDFIIDSTHPCPPVTTPTMTTTQPTATTRPRQRPK